MTCGWSGAREACRWAGKVGAGRPRHRLEATRGPHQTGRALTLGTVRSLLPARASCMGCVHGMHNCLLGVHTRLLHPSPPKQGLKKGRIASPASPAPRPHLHLLLVDLQDLVHQREADHAVLVEGQAVGGQARPHAPQLAAWRHGVAAGRAQSEGRAGGGAVASASGTMPSNCASSTHVLEAADPPL